MTVGEGRTGSPGKRAVALGAVAVVLATGLFAAFEALRTTSSSETPCWVLPNLRIMAAPGNATCPLETHDAIRKLGWGEAARSISDKERFDRALGASLGPIPIVIEREGRPLEVLLPVRTVDRTERLARVGASLVAAGLLLVVPLLLLRRSASGASIPLAVLNTTCSLALAAVIAGQHSEALTVSGFAAVAVLPATLCHLALRFPRDRALVRDVPAIVAVPYLVGAFLMGLGCFALIAAPLLWPAFVLILVAVMALSWSVLMASCWFAARESDLPIERARARIVFYGSILLPVVPAVVLASSASSSPGDMLVSYFWSAVATLTFPIAVAISRYNLFDLGLDTRQVVARLTYLSVAALVVSLVLRVAGAAVGVSGPTPGAAPVLALSFVCVAALEPLRSRMPGLIEAAIVPRLRTLRELTRRFELESNELDDEDAIAALLGDVLAEGVSPSGVGVFLERGARCRSLAYAAGGSPPRGASLADEALGALTPTVPVLHLAEIPHEALPVPRLRAAEVEMVAAAQADGEIHAVVLLRGPGRGFHYGGLELEFVASLAAQAGRSIARARARGQRVERERRAAAGRLALVLAHDTGKDINWIARLAARIPRWRGDERRWLRDAAAISELGTELLSTYRRIMAEASDVDLRRAEMPPLDAIIDRTIRRIARRFGPERVTDVVEPSLRDHRFPEYVGRLIGNLLENALEASPGDSPVRLSATHDGGWVRVVIEDEGHGPPPEIASRLFEAGVSSRAGEGGHGIGLTVALEIAEMLGGTVSLERMDEVGVTRATLFLPIDRPT